MQTFNSPWVRMSIDTGHANLAHGRGAMPGQGSVPWAAVFEALGQLSQQPRLILELKGDPRDGQRWLSEHGLAR